MQLSRFETALFWKDRKLRKKDFITPASKKRNGRSRVDRRMPMKIEGLVLSRLDEPFCRRLGFLRQPGFGRAFGETAKKLQGGR